MPQDFLDEGSIIQTDWLEGKISALQNQVEAGGGTVTITEDDGILIEDLTKTKAIRLLGGMLALANERDPGSGLYNWRSFGTGDGFLADLVETGFIQWTRAKGGQLTLGGEIMGYEVGQSVLTITMDGKVKGDADTTRIIKYANPTYEVQPASFTLEVNAGYANVAI